MRYLSVCSGIEAASVAWHNLGWAPVAFAEVDPSASAVLAHRHGSNMPGEPLATNGVPNLGDITKFEEWPDADVDVLVGGTPCQDYSVAGKRLGMAGERGSLTLTYIQIAARYRPGWIVWENVPGVLSSHGGRDFARFLGDLSGQTVGVPAGGWKNAGVVPGIGDAYGLAYRVLDAQFTRTRDLPRAVPQRRRRVFVIGYLGDWRRAAAVLFDAESLRGDPPPRREAGQGAARGAAQGVALRGREGGATAELTGSVSPALRCAGGGGDKAHALVAPTLSARTKGGGGLGTDFDCDGGLITMAHGQGGAEISVGHGPTLTCNHEAPIVAHALRAEGFDASEDGTGRGTPLVPVAVTDTLVSNGDAHSGFRDERGLVPVAFDLNQITSKTNRSRPDPAVHHTLPAASCPPHLATEWAVRRLTPVECERLQGFPDNWTAVPNTRGKPAADGPRYKQLGNSMATNCMEWIGERIALVAALGSPA